MSARPLYHEAAQGLAPGVISKLTYTGSSFWASTFVLLDCDKFLGCLNLVGSLNAQLSWRAVMKP